MAVENVSQATMCCTSCREEKLATAEFFPAEGSRLRRQCRSCRARAKRLWRQTSETPQQRERRLSAAREYAARNAAKLSLWRAQYNEATKDARREYDRARYISHRDEVKQRAREWRAANLDSKREANRAWAAANKEKMARSGRESKARRRRSVSVRLGEAVSAGIRKSLGTDKGGQRWERAVGYSAHDLRVHLERQFRRGMTWENYGEWHIDHILPVAGFSFSSPDDSDFLACWALANLRPMWAAENIRKSDKRLHLI